jgi:hypothetical protein
MVWYILEGELVAGMFESVDSGRSASVPPLESIMTRDISRIGPGFVAFVTDSKYGPCPDCREAPHCSRSGATP